MPEGYDGPVVDKPSAYKVPVTKDKWIREKDLIIPDPKVEEKFVNFLMQKTVDPVTTQRLEKTTLKNVPASEQREVKQKISEIASITGLDEGALMLFLQFESGFNKDAVTYKMKKVIAPNGKVVSERDKDNDGNDIIESVGILGFQRQNDKGTINLNGTEYKLSDIAKMNHSQQLDLAKEYFQMWAKMNYRPKNIKELFLLGQYPNAINHSNNDKYVFGSERNDNLEYAKRFATQANTQNDEGVVDMGTMTRRYARRSYDILANTR